MDNYTNQNMARPWYRRPLRILLLLAALFVVIFLVWRINLSFSVKARLKALQQAGHPVTLAELEQLRYPPIAAETNTAAFFNDAIAHGHFTNASSQKLMDELWPYSKFLSSTQLFSAEYQRKIAQLLDENRETLDLLHRNPPGTQGRYALDFDMGYRMILPHLAPLSRSVQLLSLQAVIHADQNQMGAVMEDLNSAFRVIDSLADEPILISHLTRSKCQKAIFCGLERILGRRSFTEAQLLELSSAFYKRKNPRSLTYALEGELCCGSQIFQMPPQQLATLADENTPPDSDSFAEKKRGSAGNIVMNWSGFTPRDFNFYLGIMSEHLAASKIPFPERLQVEEQLGKRVVKESRQYIYLYSGLLLPALNQMHLFEADDFARLNIIQTVFATERYRASHQNALPERLEDLVPLLLQSLPADPYTGKNLHYKKLASGYTIYSIGRNKKDDGGIGKTSSKVGGPDDITFTVER
jgi:hypothetical protein